MTSLTVTVPLVRSYKRLHVQRARMCAEYEAVTAASSDCILLLDDEYRITSVNAAGEKLLGFSRRVLLGQTIGSVLATDDSGYPLQGAFTIKTGPDREVIVEATYGYFPDMTVVFLRDVSERHLREAELKESRQRLQRILDMIPGFVAQTNAEGRVVFMNDRFAAYYGYLKEDELFSAMRCRHVHPDQADRVADLRRKGFSAGLPFTFQQRVRRHDGVYHWFQVAMQPSLDDEGRVTGWYGLHTNVEDLIRAQESVQRLQSQLALSNQIATASELAASVVHEISQPISAMVTNAQVSLNLLTRGAPDAADVLPVLRRIVEDGKTTAGIVTVLSSLFYQGKPERTPIALQEITEEVLGLLRGRIGRAGVLLRQHVPADLPPISGSRIAIQQVMLNLLTNALDAFTASAPEKLLAVDSFFDEQTVTISVTDTGTRPASYDSIFKPFVTTKTKGMGLGLSIARSIIEAHEGTLRAGPAASGPGSVFTFTLRRAGSREPS